RVDDHVAVDDDRVHAPAVGVVDEVVDGIEERLPLRPLRVEQYQIGLFAGLDRADLVGDAERLRAGEGRHLERALGRDQARVLTRGLLPEGRQVHGAYGLEVVRVVGRGG